MDSDEYRCHLHSKAEELILPPKAHGPLSAADKCSIARRRGGQGAVRKEANLPCDARPAASLSTSMLPGPLMRCLLNVAVGTDDVVGLAAREGLVATAREAACCASPSRPTAPPHRRRIRCKAPSSSSASPGASCGWLRRSPHSRAASAARPTAQSLSMGGGAERGGGLRGDFGQCPRAPHHKRGPLQRLEPKIQKPWRWAFLGGCSKSWAEVGAQGSEFDQVIYAFPAWSSATKNRVKRGPEPLSARTLLHSARAPSLGSAPDAQILIKLRALRAHFPSRFRATPTPDFG